MRNVPTSRATSALNPLRKTRGSTGANSRTTRNKGSRNSCEPISALDRLVAGVSGSKKGPTIAFVYQDDEARTWAREISRRITKVAGVAVVQASWWKIADLTAPGILAGAVSSALRADLIVVASRAEGLPLPFYVWVNLWWPNRSETPGALIAIVGMNGRNVSRTDKIGDYLRVVAEQARMNFLSIEKSISSSPQKHTLDHNKTNGSSIWNGHLHD